MREVVGALEESILIGDEPSQKQKIKKVENVIWGHQEHGKFIQALKLYGKSYKSIAKSLQKTIP